MPPKDRQPHHRRVLKLRKFNTSIIEQMYLEWSKTRNCAHVARRFGCSVQMVINHRNKGQWIERLNHERAAATTPVLNAKLDDVKADVIGELRAVKVKALNAAIDSEYRSAREASLTYFDCVNKELELLGHLAPKDAGILALAAKRLATIDARRRTAGLDAEKEIPHATIVPEDESGAKESKQELLAEAEAVSHLESTTDG